ncbi:uracil permease, putative [Metarhizium acridum CQMa 102]|uniref:Uracil permease, putative n=2 Tax=Metarhizium acridum TaxID=92637 RepID=E9E761_METAQ|nr:uracil permease, putative [Metarhizium acridum CQMa 102]EFY88236.1 uracil permease, putative [Metarhizium acridum CQMa 102]
MFHEPGAAPNVGWAFMFSLTAILGAWGGGTLGQSDWTRYATKQMAPVPSQLIASPLTITVTAVIGIVVTSAARDILGGEVIWNPIYLLAAMQEYYGSNSGVRAGVFFGGLGLVASQLAISVVLNAMSCGMDMAGLWPQYINIRRGAAVMAVIGIAIQPWQLLATAAKFLQVLSGFGVFLAPLTGIMLADYHIVRQRKLKINDLYRGDSSSIYWYRGGLNWRAPVAFFMGAWPMLPGLVASVDAFTDPSWVGWIRLYNLTFIVGLAIGFVVFLGLNLAFPPPGLGEEAEFEPINDSRPVSFDGPSHAQFDGHHGQQEKTAPVYIV